MLKSLSLWSLRRHQRHLSTHKCHSSTKVIPSFARAWRFREKTAVSDENGVYSYGALSAASRRLAADLTTTEQGRRVAFLCGNDVSYVLSQWAVWRKGGVAVPLSKAHPRTELEYVISDSQADVVVSSKPEYHEKIEPICRKLGLVHVAIDSVSLMRDDDDGGCTDKEDSDGVAFPADQRAQLVYTSGTTGRPKGVLISHGNIQASVESLIQAWDISSNDNLLHVLPLNHIHGIVNALICPLWCGATCIMLPEFDPNRVMNEFLHRSGSVKANLFMAVPTIYSKLIRHFEEVVLSSEERDIMCQNIRLMVSGSAPLPTPVMKKWHELTGHWLLERYGMTEIGMALSNPLKTDRKPGTVGTPLPSVQVQIVDEENGSVLAEGDEKETNVFSNGASDGGDLQVKGPAVFQQYWNRPDATSEAFSEDGWFKTGDTVCYRDGVYQILGRTSVDIIKSGGYKISALDIERVLLGHPDISDCAVIGLPDDMWGEVVTAIVVGKMNDTSLADLQEWTKAHLPSYSIPRKVLCTEDLPRNSMGKVNKKNLIKLYSDVIA